MYIIDLVHNFYICDLERRWDGIVSGEITDCYSGLQNLIKWIVIGSLCFILYLQNWGNCFAGFFFPIKPHHVHGKGIHAEVIIRKDKKSKLRFAINLSFLGWKKKSSMMHSYRSNFYSNWSWCYLVLYNYRSKFFPTIAVCFHIGSYPSLILPTTTYTICNINSNTFTLYIYISQLAIYRGLAWLPYMLI